MESPGYEPERELVIQAPDGTFVAFTVIRYDPLNSTGLFEPVGTHKDYRRRGFGQGAPSVWYAADGSRWDEIRFGCSFWEKRSCPGALPGLRLQTMALAGRLC